MSKAERYAQLVARRKSFDPSGLGLANPAAVADGQYDSPHIGPWTRWANDLDADVMVVGQDWGDVGYFEENRGLDKPGNPTNKALQDLLANIGRPIPPPPSSNATDESLRASSGVWLTNALLWLKTGGLSAPVRDDWFEGESTDLLKEQILLVEPKVVVALGQRAHDCVLRAFDRPIPRGPYREAVESALGTTLETGAGETTLFAVYHCGARIQNTHRSMEEQLRDWSRITPILPTR